jgi:hypothetical protein
VAQPLAQAVLAQPLRLRDGASLPGLRGVDLAPGSAFVWWQLALGAAIVALGLAVWPVLRLAGLRRMSVLPVLRLVMLLTGAIFIVRAFRAA